MACPEPTRARGAPAQLPRSLIGPSGTEAWRSLFARPNEWAETRRLVDGLIHADHKFKEISDPELRACFAALSAWGKRLELEVGAIKEWSVKGEHTFALQRPTWDHVRALGGTFTSIAMDEPLAAARRLQLSEDEAVAETAAFVQAVRQSYPDLAVGDIEPFPSFAVTDHVRWLQRLNSALRGLNLRGLDFYRVDPDWAAFAAGHVTWRDVRGIELACREQGLPFSLIYWAANYPARQLRHLASEATWFEGVMAEGSDYERTGIAPDQFVIQSWIGAPSQTIPEDNPLSFTGTALAFLRRFAPSPG